MAKNVVLVGLGMVADTHAAAVAATAGAVRLHSVFARRSEQASEFARRHDVPRIYVRFEDILADGDVDFVILLTPPDARLDYGRALAAAGLPTLMEKPLERDHKAAQNIVQEFASAGVPLGAVLQHRMRPAARVLMERLGEGALGSVTTVEVRVPWWRDQAYYDTPGRGTYARDGGGVLITQAIHTLDLMLRFCGPVSAVQAMTTTSTLHRMEAEDFAAAALSFQSGAVGSMVASTTHFPGGTEEIVLNGTGGSAVLAANVLTLTYHDGRNETFGAEGGSGGGADPMAFSADWHRDVIADFADALTEGRPPEIPGSAALPVHALIDAIQTSARTGTRVEPEHTHD